MMRSCIFYLLLLLGTQATAQNKPECLELFARRIAVADLMARDSAALADLSGFQNCGLDTIDLALMLRGPVGENIFINPALARRDTVRYGELFDNFKKATRFNEFRQLKAGWAANEQLKIRTVGASKWRDDSLLMIQIGTTPGRLLAFRDYLRQHEELRGESYETAFEKYLGEHPPRPMAPLTVDTNIVTALDRARAEKKPLLLFFSAYGCVNCEKMFDMMSAEPVMCESLRHHFVIVRLRVDDRTPLPEAERLRSDALQRPLRNVGERNAAFELENFQSTCQPLWVVAGYDKKALATLLFTRNKRDMQMFLAEGLDKFRN